MSALIGFLPNRFSVFLDEILGNVTVVFEGFWSEHDYLLLLDPLNEAINRARSTSESIGIIFDFSAVAVFSQDMMLASAGRDRSFVKYGDRLAAVCPSALVKRQIRRINATIADRAPIEVFPTRDAAEAWLCE